MSNNLNVRWLIVIAFLASLWLISLAGIALHESLERPSEAYRNSVKWFSSFTIVGAVGIMAGSSYLAHMEWKV